jgi:PIN domain nuclease of toxin-antitoxin system
MKLLLDTHIWLWSQLSPARLSAKVTRTLNNTRNELWLSPISVWEVVLLCEKGRLRLEGGPQAWFDKAMSLAPLREAALNHQVALAAYGISLPHGDAADRFLLATAQVYGLTLVTADEVLSRAQRSNTLLNR